MRRTPAALMLVAAALAGCGDDEGGGSATSDKPPTDEAELRKLAETYLQAIADEDWETACDTRSEREQRSLAGTAGTCEEAFEAIWSKQPTMIFENARAQDVRIRGDIAGIDMVQPGQSKPATTLAAVRSEGGDWKLQDVSDQKTP